MRGNHTTVNDNQITLNKDEDLEQQLRHMLVISHGMARSVKLGTLETKTENALENVKTLPNILMRSGSLNMRAKQINKHIGEILYIRGLLNLHTDLGEVPDICWEDSRLESLFNSTASQLDIKARIRKVNDKLNFAKELMDELKHQSNQQHSSHLEWIIILLIAIEVAFSLEERGFFIGYYLPYRKKQQQTKDM